MNSIDNYPMIILKAKLIDPPSSAEIQKKTPK